jgi:hypothetical protein
MKASEAKTKLSKNYQQNTPLDVEKSKIGNKFHTENGFE